MGSILWSIATFWVIAHIIRNVRAKRKSHDGLPTSVEQDRRRHGRQHEIRMKLLEIRAETTALNEKHNTFIGLLETKRFRRVKTAFNAFYSLGAVVGALGLVLGFVILAWIPIQALQASAWPKPHSSLSHAKRALDVSELPSGEAGSFSTLSISPLIPGVTVPLSHLPTLLVSVFLAQSFHELGHAIAAAVDMVPLHSIGAILMVILPTAFVSLSPELMERSAAERLRVISAGAWHNVVLCLVTYLASFGLSRVWASLGYESSISHGLAVLEIEAGSPLVHYLSPGDIITALDDMSLKHLEQPLLAWNKYLLRKEVAYLEIEGWCTDSEWFTAQPSDCCSPTFTPLPPPAIQVSCFNFIDEKRPGHCVDPVPILAPSDGVDSWARQRCMSHTDCHVGPGQSETAEDCIVLDASSHLLRITVRPPIWDAVRVSRVILWEGSREEVWEEVQVGTIAPSKQFLPLGLPSFISLFLSYLQNVSVSLFIFNLLPLPFLDGSHLLSALLDYLGSKGWRREDDADFRGDIELESLPSAQSHALRSGLRAEGSTRLNASLRFIRRRKVIIERYCRLICIILSMSSILCTLSDVLRIRGSS